MNKKQLKDYIKDIDKIIDLINTASANCNLRPLRNYSFKDDEANDYLYKAMNVLEEFKTELENSLENGFENDIEFMNKE